MVVTVNIEQPHRIFLIDEARACCDRGFANDS